MKSVFIFLTIIATFIYSCNSGKSSIKNKEDDSYVVSDTIHLKNDKLEYDIIIIEPGFESWLVTQQPRGYYGITFLENRNRLWVGEYNRRVLDSRYSKQLYEQEINYDPTIHYGLEVNYLLYNYLKYFQQKYKQKLIPQ